MSIERFDREHLIPTAWKNGGGTTREIVRIPPGSTMESFDWRASIAEISANGPFSTFVGFDRVLVLLSGDGVHLRSDDGRIDHRLDIPMVPFEFEGESRIEASVIGGTSDDFNIMTRRATIRAGVQVVVAPQTFAKCSAGVLFAVRGEWEARSVEREARVFSLGANSGLWWSGESVAWRLTPGVEGDVIVAARIQQVMGGSACDPRPHSSASCSTS